MVKFINDILEIYNDLEQNPEKYKKIAESKGFLMVASGPLVRSSYHADEDFAVMKAKREKVLEMN